MPDGVSGFLYGETFCDIQDIRVSSLSEPAAHSLGCDTSSDASSAAASVGMSNQAVVFN